jgi:hypothetical protein
VSGLSKLSTNDACGNVADGAGGAGDAGAGTEVEVDGT